MIYILRHGKTELNKANVLQGHIDYPLNDEGVLQAGRVAELLRDIRFDYVFSSPLVRALQTTKIVVPGKEPVIDNRLIEMDYGPYDGKDLKDPTPEVKAFFSDFIHNPAPEGMESLASVVKRTSEFLNEIRALEGNILISTHAIAMKGILENLTPKSHGSYWSKYIGNCALYAAENRGAVIGIPYEYNR